MNGVKMTYVAEDNTVGVDGEFYKVETKAAENIRAIQWNGTSGEIEYNDGTLNLVIDNANEFQFLLEAWNLANLKANKPKPYSKWDDEIPGWVVDENLKIKYEIEVEIQEAKFYLQETDFKMLPDYAPKEGSESIESIKEKRFFARELIRKKELTLT